LRDNITSFYQYLRLRYLRIVLRSDFQNQGSRNASTSEELLERSFLPSFARFSQGAADRTLARAIALGARNSRYRFLGDRDAGFSALAMRPNSSIIGCRGVV